MLEDATFMPLGSLETYMASSMDVVEANIFASLKRKLPEIENLPEWRKSKGNEAFAIVGGGPSIRYTVNELRSFHTVIAAGSSHDWLVQHGIRPTYTLVLDPDRASANYLKHPDPRCNYLIASCCDPAVFDALDGYSVTRWHAAGHDADWFVKAWIDAGFQEQDTVMKPIIGGGATCSLRCISIAMLFGYRNLHFFGCDSCLEQNSGDHHAYDFVDPVNEHLGDVVEVRIGTPSNSNGRLFRMAKYMLAQLWGFRELMDSHGKAFDVTIHGDGALLEFVRVRKALREAEKANV